MNNEKPLIMIVDDQTDFVEGVKLILEEEGYDVWTASNGREAFDKLTSNLTNNDTGLQTEPLPSLILADIMMPIMDGYTLYENTQADPHLKYIPFIFLTAKTDPTDIDRGKALGVEDYLTKPCLPDILLASVRGQLRHSVKQVQPPVVTTQPVIPDSSGPSSSGMTILIFVIGILIIAVGYWFGG